MKDLRKEVFSLKCEIEQLKLDVKNQEQYSRRNCLLVHGIPDGQGKSTGSIDLNAINKYLKEGLTEVDIENRVGKPKHNKKKPRLIVIKFL